MKTLVPFLFAFSVMLTSCMQEQTWWPGKPNKDIHSNDAKKSQHYKDHKHID